MSSTDAFSSQQISELILLATSLAAVPKEQRAMVCNEVAAYMHGFSSGLRATISRKKHKKAAKGGIYMEVINATDKKNYEATCTKN